MNERKEMHGAACERSRGSAHVQRTRRIRTKGMGTGVLDRRHQEVMARELSESPKLEQIRAWHTTAVPKLTGLLYMHIISIYIC